MRDNPHLPTSGLRADCPDPRPSDGAWLNWPHIAPVAPGGVTACGGFLGPCDDCLLYRQGGLHGHGRDLFEPHRAHHPVDLGAWDNRAQGAAIIEFGAMARLDGVDAAFGPAFVRCGQVFAAVTAEDDALKQGLALARCPGSIAAGEVALQTLLVGFAFVPAEEPGCAWRPPNACQASRGLFV